MSETTSRPTGTEPTENWYRESTASMPVSSVPAQSPTAGGSAPALRQPHWSGKKTAVAAALAIGLSSVGVVGAAAVVKEGSSTAFDGPGAGFRRGQFPGGQVTDGQAPNGQFPGGQIPNNTTDT